MTASVERTLPRKFATLRQAHVHSVKQRGHQQGSSTWFGYLRRQASRAVLLITMFCLIFPIFWLIQSSLSTQVELFHTPAYFFPPHPSFDGFRQAWPVIGADLWHSAIIAIGTVALTLAITITAGFGILQARVRRTATLIRLLVLVGLVFPTKLGCGGKK